MYHRSPNLEIIRIVNLEDREIVIGRAKLNLSFVPMGQVEILHREVTIPPRQYDRAVMGFYSPVDNHSVAIEDTSILHRVTAHIPIERSLRVLDVIPIKVKCLVPVIVSRRPQSPIPNPQSPIPNPQILYKLK